jgi:predicted ATPase
MDSTVKRGRARTSHPLDAHGFLRSARVLRDEVPSFEQYPFSIPAIRGLDEIDFDPKITFFVGENGSGKSTLLEAIAVAAGFNAEGGTKNFRFSTRSSESTLHRYLRVARGIRRWRDGFFLRAESYFNLATEIEVLDKEPGGSPIINSYGGKSLHEQSHGESFLALAQHRFGGDGLYLLDEPEAALSPRRQLTFLKIMHDLIETSRSQFIVATHSPILMAYPAARLYQFDENGIRRVEYEETEHFQVTRDFLAGRERFFKHLFADTGDGSDQ